MNEFEIPSPDGHHDPEGVARDLARKLASRARHVCILVGAGASAAAGLQTLAGLQDLVVQELSGDDAKRVQELLQARNLEQVLSRLRRLAGVLEENEVIGELTAEGARDLDQKICAAIMKSVDSSDADTTAFDHLASWAGRMDYQSPLELFTVNYDVLLERGLETARVPYFDGFIGSVQAPFIAELVEPRDAISSRLLPPGFVRLWKLHGSTNWRVLDGEPSRTVRVSEGTTEGALAIYPSDEKYEESRRLPFVVLMDRFRRALLEPETITIVTGFSFGDDHLNEHLFDAARRHPRSEVLALCHGAIPDTLAQQAGVTRNLVVLSPTEAILDGRRAAWRDSEDIPDVFENERFLLGDFSRLAGFLSRQVSVDDASE